MRERSLLLLSETLGVGSTFIDFDTFNVEGLWVCFEEKLPRSTGFITIQPIREISNLPWQEFLVKDETRMAEYDFFY